MGGRVRSYKIATALLLIVSVALLIALIVVSVGKNGDKDAVTATNSRTTSDDCVSDEPLRHSTSTVTDLFRDLSKDELHAVRDYVLNEKSLNVTKHSEATEHDNYIFLIELMNPDKETAVMYLDGQNQKKPERKARVVIMAGAYKPPIVEEILVPVIKPTSHTKLVYGRKNPIPYSDRPFGVKKYAGVFQRADIFTTTINHIMKESFEMNCTASCTFPIPSSPLSETSEFWIRLHRLTLGITTNPLPLELRFDTSPRYVTDWNITGVLYNEQLFDSVQSFITAYDSGKVTKIFQAAGALHGSLDRRGSLEPSSPKVEPAFYEPGGKRYTSEENHIEYMGWAFDFRLRSSSGLQLFNINFNNSRIIYELSAQEAIALYGGGSPTSMYSRYLDSSWAPAKRLELAKGIDCPETATYYDVISFVDSDVVTKRPNALCVFELNTGGPLRRHFETSGDTFMYGGMVNTVLVVRTIWTPYNYDYIFDYIFYQNGVIETKVSSMGYIMGVYWSDKEQWYGTRVHKDLAGPIHDHLFNFKVDLDVAGRKNSFELIRSKVETNNKYSHVNVHYNKYYEREHKKTEKDAKYNFNFQTPSYLNFYNEKEKNAFGVRRGFRISLKAILHQLYPSNWSSTRGISWSHQQLAVTKYKQGEDRSTSIYNQLSLHDPLIDFNEYINDNDDITNEDLVAWVTVGVMHLPHSEDLPITTVTGTEAGFFILPYNYFDEDPSISSRDNILVTANHVSRPKRDPAKSCTPRKEPFSFHGELR